MGIDEGIKRLEEVPNRIRTHLQKLGKQNRFDKPHRSAGATQAAPLREEQRLLMGSHHDDDETKGSVYLFVFFWRISF